MVGCCGALHLSTRRCVALVVVAMSEVLRACPALLLLLQFLAGLLIGEFIRRPEMLFPPRSKRDRHDSWLFHQEVEGRIRDGQRRWDTWTWLTEEQSDD